MVPGMFCNQQRREEWIPAGDKGEERKRCSNNNVWDVVFPGPLRREVSSFGSNFRSILSTTRTMTKEMIISGEIIFTNGSPEGRLPKPSQLTVKLSDCRRADAASIDKCVVKVDAHESFVPNQPLKFRMVVPNFEPRMDYSMSAVLNVGWVPDEAEQEWIRCGDYLNDTSHSLCISDASQSETNFNINVIHYT